MQLQIKDIENLWKSGCASLVAGRGGRERNVDSYDMMEQPDIKPWLREHVLIITTGYAIRNDSGALLALIRDLHEVNASGLAIKTRFFEEFPKEALALADELEFPLFFLNNDAGFSEIVSPVMTAIVEAKNQVEMGSRYRMGAGSKRESAAKLFLELQTGKITQEEEADYRTTALRWPEVPIRLIVVQFSDKKNGKPLLEMKREQQEKTVQTVFSGRGIPCECICRKAQSICIVSGTVQESALQETARELTKKAKEQQKCAVTAVITGALHSYLEIQTVCREVTECFYILRKQSRLESVFRLEELRYERIMMHAAQSEEVKEFVRVRLGALEQYDREHEAHLMETLEMLIAKNGSRKLTAEALFLHRNTMSYRLHQIETVLGESLADAELLSQLGFACKVRKYMEM